MSSFKTTKRVWFDVNIGANPSTALALLFALKKSEIEVVGLSISGKNQEQRKQEALSILKIGNREDISVFLGEEISANEINELGIDSTVTTGPLTNISRLVLEEAELGKLHILGGCFRGTYIFGELENKDPNVNADLDSARIVLTQSESIALSSLEASSLLILESHIQQELENAIPELAPRFSGYKTHLEEKHGSDFGQIILGDLLAVCDVLDTPTITREIVEFVFQANGTFMSTYPLSSCPNPIEKDTESKKGAPAPTVKCEVIRTVESVRIIQELRNTFIS